MSRVLLLSGSAGEGLPTQLPSRDQVCRVRHSFAGLTVVTQQYGSLPWYDMALFALAARSDRQRVYDGKHAAGDRHCLMSFDPDEGGYVNRLGPYKNILIPYSHLKYPDRFRTDLVEVLTQDFVPIVNLGCDKDDALGVGYTQAVERLRALRDVWAGTDFHRRCLVLPGWDGVFYGWEPEELEAFGKLFRELFPDGYLAVEHQPGRIPVGGGQGDWKRTGRMSTYDVLLHEFDFPQPKDGNYEENMGNVWQVALRSLGPKWIKPADAPDYMTTAYATGKWYLGEGSDRGPTYVCAFEWSGGTFAWVQGGTTSAQVAADRAYLSALGYGDCTG